MRKYIWLFLILFFLIPAVAGDGMAFKGEQERWILKSESQQLAAINFENGYENLLLAVIFEDNLRDNTTVWIFPVPAQPEEIEIDVLKGYPQFGGKSLDRSMGETAGKVFLTSAAFGTFPASLPLCLMGGAGFFTLQKSLGVMDPTGSVVIHKRVEKMGLTTELVTARDGTSLENYVAKIGHDLPDDAESILEEYTGQDYSFVISYISNTTEFAGSNRQDESYPGTPHPNLLGVFARFPADQIYFPLRPTSVYGNRTIPVLLYVNGFVTPLPDDKIRPVTEVTYLVDDGFWNYYSADELGKFFNNPTVFGQVKYTRIRITAPAESFTRDLWINPVPPADVSLKENLIQYPLFWSVPLYILVSMVLSLLAGIVVFGNNPAYRKVLALHGIWNCATMIGFACGTAEYLKIKGATGKQKLGFFIVFYVLLTLIFSVMAVLANPQLGKGLLNIFGFHSLLPFIGFRFGIYIFPENPLLAVFLFVMNTAFYIVAWLTVKRYL
jgi:hypothetical protein